MDDDNDSPQILFAKVTPQKTPTSQRSDSPEVVYQTPSRKTKTRTNDIISPAEEITELTKDLTHNDVTPRKIRRLGSEDGDGDENQWPATSRRRIIIESDSSQNTTTSTKNPSQNVSQGTDFGSIPLLSPQGGKSREEWLLSSQQTPEASSKARRKEISIISPEKNPLASSSKENPKTPAKLNKLIIPIKAITPYTRYLVFN
jgi:hypothetical protein